MGFLSKIFGTGEASNKMKAIELTNRAFHLFEQRKFDSAIDLLKQAIKIDPLLGDAYNELAVIYGRVKGDLDLAAEYAQHAVECDPRNPKFYNAVNVIQLQRAQRLKTRREIRQGMRQRLEEIQRNIDKNPSYPPAYLAKAVALALTGEPEEIWEAELTHAEKLYSESRVSATGLPITVELGKSIVDRNRKLCRDMSSYWDSVPEDQ
jgi:tetratricopeptide (TPR) repeat protein